MFARRVPLRCLQPAFTMRLSSNMIKRVFEAKYASILSGQTSGFPEETPQQTMSDVKDNLYKILGTARGYNQKSADRTPLMKYLPESQDEIPHRQMSDSFDHAVIPLSNDVNLQNKYITPKGFVRRGRLLEDMDMFAVWVAFKHIHIPKCAQLEVSPYNFVTAVVDEIAFTPYIPEPEADIRLSGHVSWVGTSSVEVTVWLEQRQADVFEKITRSIFLLAARNAINTGSAIVNRLIPTNEKEEALIKGGLARRDRRIRLQQNNLLKMVPDEIETKLIHALFVDTVSADDKTYEKRSLPNNSRWMDDTMITTFISSHPENRNMHNTVFGGFIMRQAMELSYNCCFMYINARPQILYIGDIIFHRPIPVGSLIKLISRVVYTQDDILQLTAYAEAHDMATGAVQTTNEFHFTYRAPCRVTKVIPRAYNESMMYINGRRHFMQAMNVLDL